MKDETKNKVTVDIFGQKYKVMGAASNTHLEQVAKLVDNKMTEIASNNPSLDTTRTAVLAAVNLADEYVVLQEKYEELLRLVDEQTKE